MILMDFSDNLHTNLDLTLFPALFRIFGGILGAVLRIFAVSAPQGPLAMLSTYGYCTL